MDQVELEIAKEAAKKAQREHEEKQRKKEELEKKRDELERQRVELEERQKREREKLMEKIRRAEEKGNEKAKGVVTTATTTEQRQNDEAVDPPADDAPKTESTNEATELHEQNGETSERKAQLQKMLADLQNQVSPHHSCKADI